MKTAKAINKIRITFFLFMVSRLAKAPPGFPGKPLQLLLAATPYKARVRLRQTWVSGLLAHKTFFVTASPTHQL